MLNYKLNFNFEDEEEDIDGGDESSDE